MSLAPSFHSSTLIFSNSFSICIMLGDKRTDTMISQLLIDNEHWTYMWNLNKIIYLKALVIFFKC